MRIFTILFLFTLIVSSTNSSSSESLTSESFSLESFVEQHELNNLPPEIVLDIVERLDTKSILKFTFTSKYTWNLLEKHRHSVEECIANKMYAYIGMEKFYLTERKIDEKQTLNFILNSFHSRVIDGDSSQIQIASLKGLVKIDSILNGKEIDLYIVLKLNPFDCETLSYNLLEIQTAAKHVRILILQDLNDIHTNFLKYAFVDHKNIESIELFGTEEKPWMRNIVQSSTRSDHTLSRWERLKNSKAMEEFFFILEFGVQFGLFGGFFGG